MNEFALRWEKKVKRLGKAAEYLNCKHLNYTWWWIICRHGNGIWWHPIIRLDVHRYQTCEVLGHFDHFHWSYEKTVFHGEHCVAMAKRCQPSKSSKGGQRYEKENIFTQITSEVGWFWLNLSKKVKCQLFWINLDTGY